MNHRFHEIVARTKKILSQEKGKDVGTPATIDYLLEHIVGGDIGGSDYVESVLGTPTVHRETLISAYLTQGTIKDEHEKDQLEGELVRFCLQEGLAPCNLEYPVIAGQLVIDYLDQNELFRNGHLAKAYAERYNFDLQGAIAGRELSERCAQAWRAGAIAKS